MTWVSELQSLEVCKLKFKQALNQQPLQTSVGVDPEEVSHQSLSIDNHVPDFTITVDRDQAAVVVTLLGTRIFPNPNIYDVVMDLRAETVSFLDGELYSDQSELSSLSLNNHNHLLQEKLMLAWPQEQRTS